MHFAATRIWNSFGTKGFFAYCSSTNCFWALRASSIAVTRGFATLIKLSLHVQPFLLNIVISALMVGASFIELKGSNHYLIQIGSVNNLLSKFFRGEHLAVSYDVCHLFEGHRLVFETLLVCALVQGSNCVLMIRQEFVPLLVLLMEVLVNSNPLAQEFCDDCLFYRVDF